MATIVIAIVMSGGASHPSAISRLDLIRPVVDAAPLTARSIAPRLSGGFAWAPLKPVRRGTPGFSAIDSIELATTAASLVAARRNDSSPEARHAVALCELLLGDPRVALATLETLTREQPRAALWNDLAAAQLHVALRDDDPARLAKALAAADAALDANPEFQEAHFNRALILEALGLRDPAREQWQKYLAFDSSDGWADEARQHVAALAAVEPFSEYFARQYSRLLNDAREARALARQYPQEARVAGEEEILACWGESLLAGNTAQAAKQLALAREIGAELLRNGGDEMLPSLVDAIERSDSAERRFLAHAHVLFREGRQAYRGRRLEAAEEALVASSEAFSRGSSPGALLARAFTANTVYERARVAEAGERLRAVMADAGKRFPALRAGVLWQMGGVPFAASQWGPSLDAFRESIALYERLREQNYAAVVRGLVASIYTRVGQPAEAWRLRTTALRELGRTPSFRLHQAIDAVTQAALADQDWNVALSFLGLDIDLAERMGNVQVTIESRLSRAELRVRNHQLRYAEKDLHEALRLIDKLEDPTYRAHYRAIAKAIEATLTPNQAKAVSLLTEAIHFHATAGRRMHLPRLYMLRGRAHRLLENDTKAAEDFEAGIAELEKHRTSLDEGDDRWGIFHAAGELFASAITIALERDDPERAFSYAERERARGLLDSLGTSWSPVAASDIPAGTVLVEYAALEQKLVIFTLDARGVRAVERAIPREVLRRQIASFDDPAALYRLLVEPVEQFVAGAKQLAFVPDPRLGNLPFAALRDRRGQLLIDDYAVTVVPSAAVFTRLRETKRNAADQHVLIVTGSNELGALTSATAEANAVAAQYRRATRLTREQSTPAAFIDVAASADVIHFAGHGVASNHARQAGYLLLNGNDDAGRLDVKEIAALRLLRTSVVVLAACDTASGEVRSTEGTISVARAFLAAGVRSVVATLRPIDDADAARFFPRFHRHIARGLSPAEALRETQLEWIRDGGATDMWTAVQIIGD